MNAKYEIGEWVEMRRTDGIMDKRTFEVLQVATVTGSPPKYMLRNAKTNVLQVQSEICESRLRRHYKGNRSDALLDRYMDYMILYRLLHDGEYLRKALECKEEWNEGELV